MGKLHLQTTIAWRNIFRQPRRSALTILAISFSVFCIIIFQALKVGLHQKMIDGSLGLDLGAVQIHAAGYEPNVTKLRPLEQLPELLRQLTEYGITSYSLRVKAPALVLAGTGSSSVLLSGIDPDREKKITFIGRRVIAGDYVRPGGDSLLVGRPLVENLKLAVGDRISIMLQDVNGRSVMKNLAIGGIYDTGLASFDRSHLYLPLAALQSILGLDHGVTEIAVAAEPDTAAETAARLTSGLAPGRYQVTDWKVMAPDLVQLMELNDATFRLLVIIIFFIVAMGIANTMNSVIFERFREFGTIAAIGTTPAEIVSLVSFESLFLGLFACFTGTAAGLLVCLYLNIHGIDLSRFTSTNQYFAAGSVLHAFVLTRDIAGANLITLLTALVAGLYPAFKASRLNPVDALNYN